MYNYLLKTLQCTTSRDVYIMDPKAVPCSHEIHQGKYVRVPMKLEVPKRPMFRPTLHIVMVQHVFPVREANKVLSHQKAKRPW